MSRRVLKNHLKSKGEVINETVKKGMTKLISRSSEVVEGNSSCPSSLTASAKPFMEKLEAIKSSINDEDILTNFLQDMSDVKLKVLLDIFNPKKKRACVEDRVLDSAFIVIDELDEMNRWIDFIQHLKKETIETWMRILASKHFNEDEQNHLSCNPTMLHEMVKQSIAYRDGIKRASQRTNQEQREEPETSGCCVM
ncbi:unnamed protein product [Symbiodinium sp. CCMP2592]|nr:unnamed protein product [Symbiodinium sp. CCMP2592]